jgi:hypothetical protein
VSSITHEGLFQNGNSALFPPGLLLLGLSASNAGHYFIKRFFGRHLFAAAFVLPVFVFAIAGSAARLEYLFTHHRDNGMVSAALASRTMVINIIAQSHQILP